MIETEGISIEVYSRDHNPPHVHVFYAEFEILINIKTLEFLAGNMPNKPLQKAIKLILTFQNEFLLEFEKLNPSNRK